MIKHTFRSHRFRAAELSVLGLCFCWLLVLRLHSSGDTQGTTRLQQAIELISASLGLPDAQIAEASDKMTEDSSFVDATPFLGSPGKCDKILRTEVVWSDSLIIGDNQEARNDGRMVCYLDSLGKSILRIVIFRQPLDIKEDRDVSREIAEAQLTSHGERYVSYPAHAPSTSLLDAMRKLPISPTHARQIEAVYVLRMSDHSTPRPSWVITVRGVPPLPVMGPRPDQVPIYQRNHRRYIVDDESGTLVKSTSYPQPPLDSDDPFKKAVDEYMRSKGK